MSLPLPPGATRIEWEETFRMTGKICVFCTCPFCQREVLGYWWSIFGSGKRCTCGALLRPGWAFPKGGAPMEIAKKKGGER